MTSTSRKTDEMYFSLFLPLSTVKSLGQDIENKHKKTLKGAEKKADPLGTVDPRTSTVVSSLGCVIVVVVVSLRDSTLGTEKAGNLETPRTR